MDAFGHVTNTQFFRYLESGRIAYLEEVLQIPLTRSETVILADIQCAFRQQLRYPTMVEVATRVARIGNSSLQLACAIYRKNEAMPVATSMAVLVWFDTQAQRPKSVPQRVRQAIMEFEVIAPEI
jgi:acyl-CoA thioester hydrolase